MVFRNFKKRVSRVKKSTWYGRRYMSKGGVGRLVRDVKKLKSVINSELKHKDINTALIGIADNTSNWSIQLLNGLNAQDGADPGERHGMTARFKSLQMRGRVVLSSGLATSDSYPRRVRMVIFVDKEPLVSGLATPPTVTEMFTAIGAAGSYVDALRSWDSIQQKRFTVLYSRVFVLDNDKPEYQFNIYKKLNMVTSWQNGYITNDAINNNALYVAFIQDGDNAGTSDTSYQFHQRLTFYDN